MSRVKYRHLSRTQLGALLALTAGLCTSSTAAQETISVEEVVATKSKLTARFDTRQAYPNWSARGTFEVSRVDKSGKQGFLCNLICDGYSQSKVLFPTWFMVHIYKPNARDVGDDVDNKFLVENATSAVSLGSKKGMKLSAFVRPRKNETLLGVLNADTPPGEYYIRFLFGNELARMQLTPGIGFVVGNNGDVAFAAPTETKDAPKPTIVQRPLLPLAAPKPATPTAHHPDLPVFSQLRAGKRRGEYGINLAATDTKCVERLLISRDGTMQVLRRDEQLVSAVQAFTRTHNTEPLVILAMIASSREGHIEAVQFSAFWVSSDGARRGTPSGGHNWMIFPAPFPESGARFAAEYGATDWYDGVPSRDRALVLFDDPSLLVVATDLQTDQRRMVGRVIAISGSAGESGDRQEPPRPAQRERPAALNTLDCGNGVTIELVLVPAGVFLMGSPESESERCKDEGPQHRILFSRAFYMGKYEVTQAQWHAVMGSNPSGFKGDGNLPVENILWNDCREFCRNLSSRSGRTVRLPSEAEWEYACRAGTTTPFSLGDTIATDQANYCGEMVYGNGRVGVHRQKTTTVGSFPANAWGLHDMHGNVWEWCEDVWHENYSGAPSDGSAWRTGGDQSCGVLRGGSWEHNPGDCRSASRAAGFPEKRTNFIGLRIVVGVSATP